MVEDSGRNQYTFENSSDNSTSLANIPSINQQGVHLDHPSLSVTKTLSGVSENMIIEKTHKKKTLNLILEEIDSPGKYHPDLKLELRNMTSLHKSSEFKDLYDLRSELTRIRSKGILSTTDLEMVQKLDQEQLLDLKPLDSEARNKLSQIRARKISIDGGPSFEKNDAAFAIGGAIGGQINTEATPQKQEKAGVVYLAPKNDPFKEEEKETESPEPITPPHSQVTGGDKQAPMPQKRLTISLKNHRMTSHDQKVHQNESDNNNSSSDDSQDSASSMSESSIIDPNKKFENTREQVIQEFKQRLATKFDIIPKLGTKTTTTAPTAHQTEETAKNRNKASEESQNPHNEIHSAKLRPRRHSLKPDKTPRRRNTTFSKTTLKGVTIARTFTQERAKQTSSPHKTTDTRPDEPNFDYLDDEERMVLSDPGEYHSNQRQRIFDSMVMIRLEDFEYVDKLGEGSFGKVYLVRRISTKDFYAMKIIGTSKNLTENDLKNILNEREIFKRVSSDFCVNALVSFVYKTLCIFVIELAPGGDLFRHAFRGDFKLNSDTIQVYVAQLVLGIQDLHNEGIIHRDIKPNNILVDELGNLKLTDYGLSDLKSKIGNGKGFRIKGSLNFMAPEIFDPNNKEIGFGVDWYALGVLIFDIIKERLPFVGETMSEVVDSIRKDPIIWEYEEEKGFSDFEFSAELKDLVARLLERDPKKRLGSSNGAEEIKKHPYFNRAGNVLDWQKVRKRRYYVYRPSLVVDLEQYKQDEGAQPGLLPGKGNSLGMGSRAENKGRRRSTIRSALSAGVGVSGRVGLGRSMKDFVDNEFRDLLDDHGNSQIVQKIQSILGGDKFNMYNYDTLFSKNKVIGREIW